MDQLAITFDDVLIKPHFSAIRSRKDIDLFDSLISNRGEIVENWGLPIMSANMDTVTGVEMAEAMNAATALACLHRFWSIEENVKAWQQAPSAWVSVGIGEKELQRAKALREAGANRFILDVAHGAQAAVAEQYVELKKLNGAFVVVGNFATVESFNDFYFYMNNELKADVGIDGVKVGIGPGSACTTRLKTGIGIPQLQAIMDIRKSTLQTHSYPGLVIADGGCRTPGDIAKALAAGADLVMVGGMLAGAKETPGEVLNEKADTLAGYRWVKKYRGSASKESYDAQGKDQAWITAEGESFQVPYKGPVSEVLQDIEGGLRSSLSYVGAKTLREFRTKAEFVRITGSGVKEGTPHGKPNG